ncbi:MAG TPA: plastocyanin/azurin family copper-binding protein [Solirubrobacterales bacterium]|nr:plastocyanin/azurin family copper-binding protein [Solirubrobacterales bacterium]
MKKLLAILAVIALATFGLAACGGDDDDDGGDTTAAAPSTTATAAGGGGGAGGTLDISAPADGTLAFDQTELSVAAGSVTVNFDNPAALSHDVEIESQSGEEVGKTDLVAEGQASTTVDLQPGTYTFYCTVPGHREAGMEGTITVK